MIFARVMLGIQAPFGILVLLGAVLAPLRSPSLTHSIITLLVADAVVASIVTTTVCLAPARRSMWWLALVTQAALATIYGWFFWSMAFAPAPEGMASLAAVMVGPPVVAIPVMGLVALLLPSARAAAFGRRSRSLPH